MTVFPDVFTEIAVLLLFAAAVGALGVRLRQPLIFAFIAVGILVGPSVLGWVSANDQVDLLAKFDRTAVNRAMLYRGFLTDLSFCFWGYAIKLYVYF